MSGAAAELTQTVTGSAPAGRFDRAVSAVAGISRAHAQRLISTGRALVDGRPARASDRLRGGETVAVELEPAADETLVPESIPLAVAYEDESMLIVDKPAGLVVHPSAGHAAGTMVHALLGRARDRGEPLGPT
ncbi:MAG TPA: S4 domain-containing protein, partial [Candidatus Limnocylindria bacterium]|nr:S4 domain-containing protein [Candidatus Limnocylindria bacterium]